MGLPGFVALRYLVSSRKRAHVALISTISVAGLAVGVAALVISISLLSGFQDHIRREMAQRGPHVAVLPARGDRLADPVAVRAALKALPGVLSVEPVVEGRAWLSDEGGTHATPVRWRNAASSPTTPAADALPPVGLARSSAGRIGAGVGSVLRVTSQRTRLSPIGPIPISVLVRVAALTSGGSDGAPDLEVPEETARVLAGSRDAVRAIEARLADPSRAVDAAARAAAALPGYRIETWRDRNAALSFALRLEKVVIFATVFLVILVAALNVVSNVALLVVEKKRDLGVLTSLGAPPEMLARIYLVLGAVIGALGTGAGLALGVVAAWALDRFRLVPLPGDVYVLSHVPFALHGPELVLIAGFSLATAMAAALLPSRAARRIAPGEAIRLSR
ncbi:MAG TPA: FtsX-like permease family protein [Thermoanaerobaculia bacterium]|jgi:lipoprotein-releasing system permease protein